MYVFMYVCLCVCVCVYVCVEVLSINPEIMQISLQYSRKLKKIFFFQYKKLVEIYNISGLILPLFLLPEAVVPEAESSFTHTSS